MLKNEPITKIMRVDFVAVQESQPLSVLCNIFEKHPPQQVPVLSGETFVGVISCDEFLRILLSERDYATSSVAPETDHVGKIGDVMNRDPIAVTRSATLRDAIRVMGIGNLSSVPVVENNNRLVGIVTTNDMLRYLAELD